MSKKLDELLETKVEIINCETEKRDRIVTVDSITEGFELYIQLDENNVFCLYDMQDEDYSTPLGATIPEALHELSTFTEYFNNHDDGDDSWESNFLYSLPEIKI